MEDQHQAIIPMQKTTSERDNSKSDDLSSSSLITPRRRGIPFFAVYDGHAGTQCAEFLKDNLHRYIIQHPLLEAEPEVAVEQSVQRAETEFMDRCRREHLESGSTAALAFILRGEILVTANVGDSEIVLSRSGRAELLTTKHHLSCNPSEVERVKKVGGRIVHNRVGHPRFNPQLVSLAVTRAIGDAGFKLDEYTDGKPSGVIATPDVKKISLTPADEFLIIGCDGLWDVMSYQQAVDFCSKMFHHGNTSQEISESIVAEALRLGSTDNVTVMFVGLQGNPTTTTIATACLTTSTAIVDGAPPTPATGQQQ